MSISKAIMAGLLFALCASSVIAQDSRAVISGAVGEVSTVDGGFTFHQPVVAPALALPLGEHVFIESRGDLREFIAQTGPNGSYQHQFFGTLEYLQADFIVSSKFTISAGRYLTPFNTFNERYSAIWIRNFQEAPLIFGIGTRTSGSSDGAMARGVAFDNATASLTYAAYFSALSNVDKFDAGRTVGARAGVFLKDPRLEFGVSYQRFLQDTHYNAVGTYLSFQPKAIPADLKAEFAHSPAGYGYWVEAATREDMNAQPTWLQRIQLAARAQQFVRMSLLPGDSLPSRNTQQVEGAFNYYLPKEVRFTFSYGRRFNAIQQSNVWNVGLTYRFMMPLGGRS